MTRRAVVSPDAPVPVGPYSQAIVAGDLVFCAGQVGLDPTTGKMVEGGLPAEAERAIENLRGVLQAEGLDLSDVVKTTVYLADIADGPTLNAIYGKYFPTPHPARATVQVAALPAKARVEIEAIAIRRS